MIIMMMTMMGVNTEPAPDRGSLEKHVLETPLQHTHTIKNIWSLIHHHTFIVTTQLTWEPSCPLHRNYVKLICKTTLCLVSARVLTDMAFLIQGLAKMVTSVGLFHNLSLVRYVLYKLLEILLPFYVMPQHKVAHKCKVV